MKIIKKIYGCTVVLSLYGRLSKSDVDDVIRTLNSYYKREYKDFIIDMKHVSHIHYNLGIRLKKFKMYIENRGGVMNVIVKSPYIMYLLNLSGENWNLYSYSSQKIALGNITKFRRKYD
ncbi:hypothetical protein KAU43_09635 [candidate division WOR-3 bacterium]|jgi:hypothetical protein|nr:hypothetical protein [candidate division WOR-3 bacterium]